MDRTTADLRHFYETEAQLRLRRTLKGPRIDLRDEFIAQLQNEGRASMIDFGAGPGHDGQAFQAAGCRWVGVDLAHGNARLAVDADLVAIQGSITALPIKSSVFDAGWCASTLMHLREPEAIVAIGEMVRVLQPGSPLMVGMWGSESERSIESTNTIPGSRRLFCLRSFETNQRLLRSHCEFEHGWMWEDAAPGEDYHLFRLRTDPQSR